MFFFAPGQSISRILSNRNDPVKDHLCLEDHLSRLTVTRQFQQSTRNSREASSFPSPRGLCSCLTLLPVRVTWPRYYYRRRWSLTPPFHPSSPAIQTGGGRFYSTPTNLKSHLSGYFLWPYPKDYSLPGVTRHRALRSADFPRPRPASVPRSSDQPGAPS